jgi:hypothetical protein
VIEGTDEELLAEYEAKVLKGLTLDWVHDSKFWLSYRIGNSSMRESRELFGILAKKDCQEKFWLECFTNKNSSNWGNYGSSNKKRAFENMIVVDWSGRRNIDHNSFSKIDDLCHSLTVVDVLMVVHFSVSDWSFRVPRHGDVR